MSAVATRLGFAAAAPPPPELRDHVLAAASRTTQLPPPVHNVASPAGRHGSAPRLAWAIAAAAFAVIIVLGTALLRTQSELDEATAREAAIVAVLSAPDARAMTRATSAGGTATVVYSLARHALIVTSANLPPPPAGKVYELWLLGPPYVRAAGLLPAVVRHHTTPVLVPHLAAGDKLGVTIEPADGTYRPTTTPILILPLRA